MGRADELFRAESVAEADSEEDEHIVRLRAAQKRKRDEEPARAKPKTVPTIPGFRFKPVTGRGM